MSYPLLGFRDGRLNNLPALMMVHATTIHRPFDDFRRRNIS